MSAAAILSIGTELTRGELVNTNGAWLGEMLTELGFEVLEHATVDDDLDRIVATLHRLAQDHAVVISTGGLGPTSDDLTTEAVARAMGVALERDESVVQDIRNKFKAFGRVMPEANAKQGDFPVGATILPNPIGTAPGFGVAVRKTQMFFVPGVPREMKLLYNQSIRPAIEPLVDRKTHQEHIRTFGLTESGLAEQLRDFERTHEGLTLGYRAHFPEIEVKVHVRDETPEAARKRSSAIADEVRGRLGHAVFGGKDDSYPAVVGALLRERQLSLAVAESCTGGRVGALLTGEPGSSEFLRLDAVVYSNAAKAVVLGVDEATLETHGAVSAEVAAEMAEGALRVGHADIAVSITGIAGPGGGTKEKPVGTVWFGLAQKGKPTITKHRKLPGSRDRVQTLSTYVALELVRRTVRGEAFELFER